jgi:hypothetical protein
MLPRNGIQLFLRHRAGAIAANPVVGWRSIRWCCSVHRRGVAAGHVMPADTFVLPTRLPDRAVFAPGFLSCLVTTFLGLAEGDMQTHAEPTHSADASPTARQRQASSNGSSAAPPLAYHILRLQRSAGNRAVASRLAPPIGVVQRETAPTSLNEAIDGTDPDALKQFRPFPPLSPDQVRKICRLVIDKNRWVGPDDEKTLEGAWRAVGGHVDALREEHWALWKECERYGAEIKLVPWMYELRTSFADKVYVGAQRNVENNVRSIREEAKRLGIAVDGAPQPPPTQETDKAVADQRALASQIQDANAKSTLLKTIPVGYGESSWDAPGQKTLPPGGVPDEVEPKKVVNFDPDKPPLTRPEPDPNPAAGIANYEAVKAIHDEMTRAIAEILNANPALYAIAARNTGSTDSIVGEDTASTRDKMAKALQDVLTNAAKTQADISSRALNFSEMLPVHKTVFQSDPQYKGAFAKKLADDYIAEEGGAEAAANKLVSLFTIALITAVGVATGGTATPVIGALISLAASAGTAAASWNDWAKLEAAAKSTVSDRNAIVTQEQADTAKLGAIISTAMAMVDVYGVGKAVKAASAGAKATVKALEGRVNELARLKKIAQGTAGAEARQVIERSVTSLGPATTVRNVGNWQKLTTALAESPAAMGKVTAWRNEVFKTAEQAAMKAAANQEGEAARAAMAIASGIEQAALGEALDAVIEIIGGAGDTEMGHIGVGGKSAVLDVDAIAAHAPTQRSISRFVQRSTVEIVEVPFSELNLGAMSPAEFERIIRYGASSGFFAAQGLPRMTVLDAKIHGGGHGYDGLGISKQRNLIQLYNLECKHVTTGSEYLPALGQTEFGTQGGLRWNEAKAKLILSADNPYAEETREEIIRAVKRRSGAIHVDERVLEDTLAGALKSARFYVFTPVWSKTEYLLAQMRGLARSGLPIGKLIRVAPRRRG